MTQANLTTAEPVPPQAVRIPHRLDQHGFQRVDDYYWLREKDRPEVRAHLEAENAYTKALMRHTETLQAQLYKEMLARIQETDMDVPYPKGPFEYYARTQQGKDYPIYCRRPRGSSGPEQVLLDLNALAEGHDFFSLGVLEVSPDARLLAFSTDVRGFREYTLQVKDLTSGELLPVRVDNTRSVAWGNDSATLFYVRENAAKRAWRLHRHRLGTDSHDLAYEEADERFSIGVSRSRSEAFLFLTAHSATTSEVRYLRANEPRGEFQLAVPRRHEHEYYLDHHGEHFLITTNDRGRNFRLVRAPLADPRPERWEEVIPHRDGVMLEGLDVFAHHLVLYERKEGYPRLRVMDLDAGTTHEIEFPEPAFSAHGAANAEYDTRAFRFVYESLVTPDSVYEYDLGDRTRRLLKQRPVRGYDPSQYGSEIAYAIAPDGARIPISMVYRRDRRARGPQPMVLTGYGAYGFPYDVRFSSVRLSLLDRGVIFAVAHVRGGGEMGKRWHDQGRMRNKRNTFTDFVAVAEHLIAAGYTLPSNLVIEGGSAGGLLMGAAANMRPGLFKAVVAEVPFVDVINTMLDPSLPLTTSEYEEWGNPADRQDFEYMLSYSPYDNIAGQPYPAMLVETSLNDSQVMYWEPAKYVAKLRAAKTDTQPLLLKINMEAGHGGASGRYDYLRELAFTYAFILWQLGLVQQDSVRQEAGETGPEA